MALTELKIKNAKPKDRMYRISDGDGLVLQIMPAGGKYWRFRYFFGGKEKMLAFGTFPEVSLADARDKRGMARKDVAAGIDPSDRKREGKRLAAFKAANTFEGVAREWHGKNKAKWSSDHAARLWRRLELHIIPALGSRPIADIAPLEILDAIRKVEDRGATELSRRVMQSCAQIFSYAVVTKRLTYNPTSDLGGALQPHVAKNYPRIAAKELPQFFKALSEAGTSEQNKMAVRLLALTFVRTIELRKAKWVDVDFVSKQWRLPPETTKTKKIHIVPLAHQTIALLEKLRILTVGKELLFPPQMRCKHGLMSENTINQLIKRMGYDGQMVGHGFRGVASTALNEMGYPPDVIERQLAHIDTNQVRAAYNHAQYLPQRQAMMQAWADHLDPLISGSATAPDNLKSAA